MSRPRFAFCRSAGVSRGETIYTAGVVGQVFVRIAEPAMELQRDVELLTFLRGLEEQRMTEAVACQPYGLAPLRSETQRTEGGAQRVGIDGLEFEAGAVGADRFHADGASVNPLPQRRSRFR